jgi:hypothetical protein
MSESQLNHARIIRVVWNCEAVSNQQLSVGEGAVAIEQLCTRPNRSDSPHLKQAFIHITVEMHVRIRAVIEQIGVRHHSTG